MGNDQMLMQDPQMDMMNDPNQQMMDMQPMQDETPMDMGADMGGMSEFDTNFDAGVQADEETDPKRYIQQLTGKLSQTLMKYNNDLGQPDVDLNKYVAGMINKQATEGLSENDVEDILSKVKADPNQQQMPMDDGENMQDQQMGMMDDPNQQQMPMDDGMGQQDMQQPMPNESQKKHGNRLSEIVRSILNPNEKDDSEKIADKVRKKGGYRQEAYMSPQFD